MQRSLLYSTLGLCAAGAVFTANLGAQNLRPAQQISPAGAFDAAIGSAGDLSCVTWVEGNTLYSAVSDGRGKTWGAPVQVSPDTVGRKDQRGDDVVVVDGAIYTFWIDRRNGVREPAMAVSTDGGATWTETVNIGGLASPVVRTWKFLANAGATSAPGDDNVWAVVAEDATGAASTDDELFVIYSANGGASFSLNYAQPGVGQNSGMNDVDGLDAKAEGNTLYLSWCDERNGSSPIADDVWFNSTTDGGVTWQHATCLNVEADAVSDGESTSIAVRGTTVAIAWEQERFNAGGDPEEALCVISTDGGATFGAPQVVGNYMRESAPAAADGNDVDGVSCIISSNGDVIVCYGDDRNGGNEVSAAVSTGGGAFVEVAGIASGGFPTAVTGVYDAMAFDDDGAPDDLVFAISYDNGASWDTVTQADAGAGDIDQPGETTEGLPPNAPIVMNDYYHGNVLAAWLDDTLGANEAYVGGFRAATTTAIGWEDIFNPSETTLQWTFKGYQDKVIAGIVLSFGVGPTTLDGRTVDMDPGFLSTWPAGSTIFLAPLTNGAGATGSIPNVWPTLFPSGLVGVPLLLNYTGLGYGSPSASITSDTSTFTL
ncbi:MAG: exo-alpha-sialidase [Planctomycetes bacterium]|nr:exo-alpha-sialidase [Planctomycetota bacterium]